MALHVHGASRWSRIHGARTKRLAKSTVEGVGLLLAMTLIHVGIAAALAVRTVVIP